MAHSFGGFLELAPVPVSPAQAARQAVVLSAKIDQAGSLAAARQAAVDAVLRASPDDEPTELRRLRLLYQHAYSTDELAGLVDNTFRSLGLAD